MNETQRLGACPNCRGAGQVGVVCSEQICSKREYHFIPNEHLPPIENELPDPLIGQLCDDYLLVKHLGAGAFGTVYLGLQQKVELKAAIKFLNLNQVPDAFRQSVLDKFDSEAKALAIVKHPNVVHLFNYGQFKQQPYLVTEFVEHGATLEDEIATLAGKDQKYEVGEIAKLLLQTLDGLAAAHENGIIHRDIKPANLMIQNRPGYPNLVRILDFGLAKFLEQGDATQVTAGTPDYMAPEQLSRERLGPWTDLYAVGVMAYELLTGQKPYAAKGIQETLFLKINQSYDPLSLIAHLNLPSQVTDFLSRSLAIEPQRRYLTAPDMQQALKDAFDVFDKRPSAVPQNVAFDGLVHQQDISRDSTAQIISLPELLSTEPPQNSEEAFQRWLEHEKNRLDDKSSKLK